MKNKLILVIFTLILSLPNFAQKIEIGTFGVPASLFKRHFTYSMESGMVDNQVKQFIAGNKNDQLIYANHAEGNSIFNLLVSNKNENAFFSQSEKILLTDFVVQPGNYDYAAGTGIYYPNGPTSMVIPFLLCMREEQWLSKT